jgi:hypothetical protein
MQIHYFQRYHSKENVDTANAMLLLSRLYAFSTNKFYSFLNETILPNDSIPDLIFTLQEKSKNSIPDALISQNSFKIVIETKLHSGFDVGQLQNHLKTFEEANYNVLLSLAPVEMNAETKYKFEEYLFKYNLNRKNPILHVNMTFESLIVGVKDVVDDNDYDFLSVLNDYEQYCFSSNLISNEWRYMRAIVAGTTFKFNLANNLYYDDAIRGFSGHEYIGLYTRKSIRAIGKVKTVIVHRNQSDENEFVCEKGKMEDWHKDIIYKAVEDGKNYQYAMKHIRYFFVEKFYETDYKKLTPYPIQRAKFIDLTEILQLKKLPITSEIASRLNELNW